VDGASTNLYITSLGNGKFSISTADGSAFETVLVGSTVVSNTAANADSPLAQWYFLSKNDRDKMLQSATTENPVDATYYIKQANISRNRSAGAFNVNAWNPYSDAGGNNDNFNFYKANAAVNVWQTIEGIPNGTYTLKMQGCTTGSAVLWANEASVDILANNGDITDQATASTAFSAGKYVNTVDVTVTNRKLSITVKSDDTDKVTTFDNFELYMTGYTPNTGVTASIEKNEFEAGQTAQITAATNPANASFNAITYSSSDEAIATVDENGLVTGVTTGTATITVTANEMENFSTTIDVTIKYTSASAADYEALNAAIEAGEAKVLGFEAGEYAPYNNIDAVAALAAAKAIDQTVSNTQIAVQEATATLNNAWVENDTEVNAIYNGDFAIAAHDGASNPQPTGWYRNEGTYTGDGYNVRYVTIPSGVEGNTSGKGLFGKFTMMYGAESGYSLPLKQGYYKLTFSYGGWNEIGTREVKLYNDDNDATVEVSTVTAANNTGHTTASSWRAYSSLITVPAAGDYTLSFYRQNTSSQNQLVLTDIVLVKATAEDLKPLLNAEIETANAIYNNGANVGTGVFQIPAAAGDAFNTAINTTAQGVYDNVSATADEVITAISDLKAAEETYAAAELNAPDPEKIYNIVVATAGHAKENNPIIIIPGAASANNPTGYALNANFEPNVNLSQAFTFRKVEGNTYTISANLGAGDVFLTNGTKNGSAAGWKASQIQATTDADNAMIFTIEAADTEAAFNIVNAETNSTIACQDGGNIYTEAGNADFKLVETTRPTIKVNTTAAGWGTVMVPFYVELPEGVKAYSVSELEADNEKLDLVEVTALEANKPYIIEGDWEANLTGDAQGTALEVEVGLLTGVYADQTATVGTYVLQMPDAGKVGFYQVADGENNQPTVTANHAYLKAPASTEVKAFFLDEGTATAIQSVFSGVAAGEIYDLSGRKLNKLQKGVNIVNGKKVMVK
jgi:uncharacterized protein YjdB